MDPEQMVIDGHFYSGKRKSLFPVELIKSGSMMGGSILLCTYKNFSLSLLSSRYSLPGALNQSPKKWT